ncbi:hypothetical protein B4098_2628 [Heyndrickxia coagulans]|uniref:Uncharacterized protein n=1 Tax=Heyndrickxia coagulans TaxID=1398 RepID=A0A150KJ86_HEYCO|nr:hypothetical protein B4098_2628 [Heyndrickxia coagulans]KYC73789.1 hypothetical protein B4099_2749 [Heyndrickxia coagulans]
MLSLIAVSLTRSGQDAKNRLIRFRTCRFIAAGFTRGLP